MNSLSNSFILSEFSLKKNLLSDFENVKNVKEEKQVEKSIEIKKELTKCSVCLKKVPLATRFKCACDNNKMFCINHRYPEEHSCKKEVEKMKLDKVVADRLKDRI